MTFTEKLKELVQNASDFERVYKSYISQKHYNPRTALTYANQLEDATRHLRVFLADRTEDIVALVEAAKASLDRPQPDLVAVPGGGHTTRNLQEIVEFDGAARERIQAALQRLEAKP